MIFVRRLIWDGWNVKHISRHQVIPEEVEYVCHNDPFVEKGKKGRLLIIGKTIHGRMLAIILDPEDELGIYYPVTARSASKKERRLYINEKEGGENRK